MSKSSKKKRRERQRANRKLYKQENRIGLCNSEGYRDYTAYSALTGRPVMSKSTIVDPQVKVHGSFNG